MYIKGIARHVSANNAATRQRQTETVRNRTHLSILLLPRRQLDCRPILADTRLRRDIQLLGAHPLLEPWLWTPDMGVLSHLCHSKLALCRPTCHRWQYPSTIASVFQGRISTTVSQMLETALTEMCTGRRVLLRALRPGLCLRLMPDPDVEGHLPHTEPQDRSLLYPRPGIQSR